MVRSATGNVIAAAAGAIALGAALSAQNPVPKPQQQVPVIRATTNLVQVDAYPTRDGRIIEGLTAQDFQLFEDGKPQAIDSLEFIRIEPNTPEALRRDPNTREEGNRLAADPRNRVFVLFLDHYHGSLAGSYNVKEPIVTMLNRMLAPNDLFGVFTPLMVPRDLVLGRQTVAIEEQLNKYWHWGKQDGVISFEDTEEGLVRCYGEKVAIEVVTRLREQKTLEGLSVLIRHLGNLRDARKALLLFTGGWLLPPPNRARLDELLTPFNMGKQTIGIGPGGVISTKQPNAPGFAEWDKCATELTRAFMFEAHKRYREVIEEAIRANVAIYPVNVNGLTANGREDQFHELANNTDGIPVITNDISAGLRKVTDDMSAYYLLGYYSTNASDGRYHNIEVKLAGSSGAKVKARRGYTSAAPRSEGSPGAPDINRPVVLEGVTAALDVLSRLRPDAEVFTYGVVTAEGIRLVAELPSTTAATPEWDQGANVQFTRSDGTGDAPIAVRMDGGVRSVMTLDPRPPAGGVAKYSVRVGGIRTVVNDRMEVTDRKLTVVGEPLLFRAAPSPQAPLRPVANFQYWRTERVVIEWPILKPLDRRFIRFLGRDGRPIGVPVTVTERERDGRPVLTAGINLAPFAQGDFVIELTATSGADSIARYVGIRVVR